MLDRNREVDDQYITDNHGKGKSWINAHARRMGAFGRPRRYKAVLVEQYFWNLAFKSQSKINITEEQRTQNNSFVHDLVREVFEERRVV